MLPSSTSIMQENHKFGEVIWPRLVANKLLRRPLGSHRFIADFPTKESLLDIESSDDSTLHQKSLMDQKNTLKYKVFVSTWNVGGVSPSDDLNLEDWLDINNNSYDIYVLGFQEVVPLSAKNVLGPERSWVSMKWNSLIRETLNKSLSEKENFANEEAKREERKKLHQVREIAPRACEGSSEKNTAENFRCIISKQMVGIMASVWVRSDLWQYVHHPSVSCIGCGVMGCLGNKGAVSVRFYLHDTSFCFVCCHLASGGKEGDVLLRNSDMADIFARTRFPRCGSLDFPQKILDHDRVVLLGDLNYRISLPESKTRFLVQQKMWNILLEKDQALTIPFLFFFFFTIKNELFDPCLGEVIDYPNIYGYDVVQFKLKFEVSVGRTYEDWNEGLITFSPTYKYYPNSDEYYGCTHNIKCEKRRAPAWCDRILWHGRGWKQTRYEKCDSRLSDHRPVLAVFSVEVEIVRSLSSLGSFFLSERLDCSVDDFNLQSNDGPNNKMSSLQV